MSRARSFSPRSFHCERRSADARISGLKPGSAPELRGQSIAKELRINDEIRVPQVRLVREEEQVGIVSIDDAQRMADEADLDLVEIAPNAEPPVAKIMDYGKYKYEQAKRERESTPRLPTGGVA